MLYIHHTSCIYPQKEHDSPGGPAATRPGSANFQAGPVNDRPGPVNNQLKAVEPGYEGIPGNVLRRMSKSVRMGVGAALPLLKYAPDGILIGTGYGGMEDSVRFLNQIIGYDEGLLTPGTFVQSTANAIASQLGLLHHNRGYNITHVSRGLSFESALVDAAMLAREHPGSTWLVGGVDEISDHHYRFECAEGWFNHGIIAGEGAAAFLVNDRPAGALVKITKIVLLGGEEEEVLRSALTDILDGRTPDLLLSGENGDPRTRKWYRIVESLMGPDKGIIRFKTFCGEYPTASAFGLWLACNLPAASPEHPRNVLIYNNYKFIQHSLILLERLL
jgi:hypothetical protein